MLAQRPATFLLIFIGVAYAIMLVLLSEFVADDAYIVANYARRFVQTGEISFNHGDHINALTSPLQFFLEVVLYAITGSLIPAYRVLSVVMVVGATWLLMRRFSGSAVVVVALSMLLTPQLITWTMGALDTTLVFFWITVLLALIYAQPHIEPRRLYAIMVVAGLAFLSRHDSVLMTVPLVLYAVYRARNIPQTLIAAAIGAVLPLAWLIYAQTTFGDVLPTSYYTKEPLIEWSSYARYWYGQTAEYITYHMLSLPGLLMVAFLVGLVAVLQPKVLVGHLRGHFGRTWWIYACAPLLIAYGLTSANSLMLFSFRLLIPYVTPILTVLAADLYQHIDLKALAPSQSWVQPLFGTAVVVMVAAQSLHGYSFLVYDYEGVIQTYAASRDTLRSHRQLVDDSRELAEIIDAHWDSLDPKPADRPYMVTFMGGIMPYTLPDAYTFEILGSWRENCPVTQLDMNNYLSSAHYILSLRFVIETPTGPTYYYDPPGFLWDDFELLATRSTPDSETDITHSHEIGVLYIPHPLVTQPLPARIDDPCNPYAWPPYTALNRWAGG